jgi:hypothetical protein
MSGDYSRFTFKPRKRFSGVLMQQGRVQLDADWNEEVDILKRRWEVQATDTFGRVAVPKKTTPGGFKITVNAGKIEVGLGRIYVDGLLAERFGQDPQHSNLPFHPEPKLTANKGAIVYLDVWEREVTYIEDPDLLEVALGGPDTATRTQVVWQVKVRELDPIKDPAPACGFDLPPASAGRLSSQATVAPPSKDPCVLPPSGNYRGLENRLYRVEIHDGGKLDKITYKWSRENASIVSRVTKIDGPSKKITVTRIGRDKVLRFQNDDWVEVIDDELELQGKPGKMAKVVTADEAAQTLLLDRDVSAGFDPTKPERHTRVRRWDQTKDEKKKPLTDGLLRFTGSFFELEDGVEIKLTADPATGELKTGDAWSFAARAVDGSVEKLTDEPPQVIRHHWAQLAWWDGQAPHDCRPLWPDEGGCCCCTIEVGDGVTSHGDFDDVGQAYAAAVSQTQGAQVPIRICILPGTHRPPTTVVINRPHVTISGCGRASRVEAPPTGTSIFQIVKAGVSARLENLYLTSLDSRPLPNPVPGHPNPETLPVGIVAPALSPLVRLTQSEKTWIEGNLFEGFDRPLLRCDDDEVEEASVLCNTFLGRQAIQAQGKSLLIAWNEITDPARDQATTPWTGPGLIDLRPWAFDVRVLENRLVEGPGHGITLAEPFSDPALRFPRTLVQVVIAGNQILGMWGTGIATRLFQGDRPGGPSGDPTPSVVPPIHPVYVYGLRLEDNTILGCASLPWVRDDEAPQGGIVVGGIEHLEIVDNQIENNGLSGIATPVAGIYVGHGRGLIVRDNVVTGNGFQLARQPAKPVEGAIVVRDVAVPIETTFQTATLSHLTSFSSPLIARPDGWPAARVHGNLVVSPRGRALTLIGLGPMQVTDNRLIVREFMPGLLPLDREGEVDVTGAVLIESAAPSITLVSGTNFTTFLAIGADVAFADNHVVLDQAWPAQSLQSRGCTAMIVTPGDLAFQDNVFRCLAGAENLVVDTLLRGRTARATGNGVFENELFHPFSSIYLLAPRSGDRCTATDNQVTHCITISPGTSNTIVIKSNNIEASFCSSTVPQPFNPTSFLSALEGNWSSILARIVALLQGESTALRTGAQTGADLVSDSELKARASEGFAERLQLGLRLAERAKEIQPSDWSLLGRVVDAQGNAVAGARLEISEGSKKLSEIPADERGEFFAHYSGEKLKDLFARKPQLKLTIKSAEGKVLQTLDRPLVPESDRVEALELRLDQPPAPPPPAKGGAPAPKAKKEARPKAAKPRKAAKPKPRTPRGKKTG